jgi:glycosyltransferase involved in cell wall biosynthesis
MSCLAKQVVMLCPHDPDLDPRVDWAATLGSERHSVTVMGLEDPARLKPKLENKGVYAVVRLPLGELSLSRSLLSALWLTGPRWLICLLSCLAILCLPLFVVMEVCLRLARCGWRAIRSLSTMRVCLGLAKWLWQRRSPGQDNNGGFAYFQNMLLHFLNVSTTLFNGLRARGKPDIVHCNDLDSLLAGVWAKKVYGCTLVYDAHELFPYSDVRQPWYGRLFFRYYEKLLVRHADHVFTVSPMLADIMKSVYGLERVAAVPNCSPISGSQHILSLPTMAISPKAIRFLFQGHFASGRGLEELIRVWARIDPQKGALLLRGPVSPVHAHCQRLAAQLGILNRGVFFPPAVGEDELICAARQAHVGVIPYKPVNLNNKYCCPNKLSQFMQASLAIVANNLPYVQEVIGRYDCGLGYNSDDEESMVAAFSRLIEDDDFRETCRQNALRFARSEFHWEIQSRPMRQMYEELSTKCA